MQITFLDLIHRHGRAAEWATAAGLLIFGMTLLLPGDTLAVSISYSGFRHLGLTDALLGVPTAIVGASRLFALYRNGMWRSSPLVRAVGAVFGAGLYAAIFVGFLWPYVTGATPAMSTGSIYIVLAVIDLLSSARAGADHGSRR